MKKAITCLFAALISHSPIQAAEEHISLRQKSVSGLVGWTKANTQHSRDGWMNSTLIIQNKNGTKKEFRAGYAFIEAWGLIDGDRFAVIRSRNSHGPARWEKFDVRSMKLIEEYHYTKGSPVPVWVNPYLDFALP